MTFCNKCGAEVEDGSKFCKNCEAKTNQDKLDNKKNIKALALGLGVVVIAVSVVLLYQAENIEYSNGSFIFTNTGNSSEFKPAVYDVYDFEIDSTADISDFVGAWLFVGGRRRIIDKLESAKDNDNIQIFNIKGNGELEDIYLIPDGKGDGRYKNIVKYNFYNCDFFIQVEGYYPEHINEGYIDYLGNLVLIYVKDGKITYASYFRRIEEPLDDFIISFGDME